MEPGTLDTKPYYFLALLLTTYYLPVTTIRHRFPFVFPAIVYPWLSFCLPPRCSRIVWSHWGEIEQFSATLNQNGFAECDQPWKDPWRHSATAGNWTRQRRAQTVRYSTSPIELLWLYSIQHCYILQYIRGCPLYKGSVKEMLLKQNNFMQNLVERRRMKVSKTAEL